MKNYFAYIRVSTLKQGEKGSSLNEQHDAIERYAVKHGIGISEWFEEKETAAKRGRRQFRIMMTRLQRGHAFGVIIHKVDRSARNLADWAELATLMDSGVDVHFAHEAMDLQTRGGRLSADIQAVVAADFIRNLRDEVKKGIYGRLKAGFYPFQAPPGYLDGGKGKLKPIDPVQGPLVRMAFETYASGNYPITALADRFEPLGLRNRCGSRIPANQMARLIANPFYFGLIRVKGQTYIGKHEPLISKALFDKCRDIAEGRATSYPPARITHDRIFRRMIACSVCSRNLTGETQKGHVYYRCHSQNCHGVSLREDHILTFVGKQLARLPEIEDFMLTFRQATEGDRSSQLVQIDNDRAACQMNMGIVANRKRKLVDAFLDELIDKAVYEERLASLNGEELSLLERDQELAQGSASYQKIQEQKFELLKALKNIAQSGNMSKNALNPAKIREIIKQASSNLVAHEKTIAVQWIPAIQVLLDAPSPYVVHQSD
jgi:site-specific DNA recombinase